MAVIRRGRFLPALAAALLMLSCRLGGGGRSAVPSVAANGGDTLSRREASASDGVSRKISGEISGEFQSGRLSRDTISPVGRQLVSMGLVNILDVDPTLGVNLVYATAGNFVGEVLYDSLWEAYLQPEAAAALALAHKQLKAVAPGCKLVVYDAARPMHVQRRMREAAVRMGKQYYVADPAAGGGLHNYGAAVDVSIVDPSRKPLPMGTGYDHLGFEANTDREQELVSGGHITEQELANRLLLRRVMREAGFRTVASEWWHFNYTTRGQAMERYTLIE